jgi:hypothetical protein
MPWKKIVVHEIIEQNNKYFFEWYMTESIKQGNTSASVAWGNGIAFAYGTFPETPEIVKDRMNGILHFGNVNFTRIGYQASFPVTLPDQSRYSVSLVQTDNQDFIDLTAWLKRWEKPKAPPHSGPESFR